MSAGYEKAIRRAVPDAQVCFDPFHVVQLGGRATDQVRRDEYNRHGRSSSQHGRWIKGARYSLLKDPANQTDRQLARLAEVQRTNKRMYRAFLLLSELRHVYRLPADEAIERLDRWLAWASRSKLKPFVKLARTIRQHKAGVRRRDRARDQQRTARSTEQQDPADLTPRLRIPHRRRPHRNGLPLLRRHHDRAPSPVSHPQTGRRASSCSALAGRWRASAPAGDRAGARRCIARP